MFLSESSAFRYPTDKTLTPVIAEALELAKQDLAAMRLHDLDHAELLDGGGRTSYLRFALGQGPLDCLLAMRNSWFRDDERNSR